MQYVGKVPEWQILIEPYGGSEERRLWAITQSELANLSVMSAPKLTEAVALVNDAPKQQAGKSPKRFKL
jgi:hypothetical protein